MPCRLPGAAGWAAGAPPRPNAGRRGEALVGGRGAGTFPELALLGCPLRLHRDSLGFGEQALVSVPAAAKASLRTHSRAQSSLSVRDYFNYFPVCGFSVTLEAGHVGWLLPLPPPRPSWGCGLGRHPAGQGRRRSHAFPSVGAPGHGGRDARASRTSGYRESLEARQKTGESEASLRDELFAAAAGVAPPRLLRVCGHRGTEGIEGQSPGGVRGPRSYAVAACTPSVPPGRLTPTSKRGGLQS